MVSIRTRANIQFIEGILKVFTNFSHSGKGYLEYLKSPKGGDEFDIRDYLIKPLFLKFGYKQSDFYNEVAINAGQADLNIGEAPLNPLITVETKSTNIRDLKSARLDQLFPYIKELHTPIGVVTNGILFEVWEQKEKFISQVVVLDFSKIISAYLKGGIDSISDDDFIRIGKLSYLKKEILSITEEDLYKIPEIDVSEPTAFKNLLTDIAAMMEVVKASVEEAFSIREYEYQDFKEKEETLSGWQLQKLKRDGKNAINTMRSYLRWAEFNNINLSTNGSAREKFITETMYILINRILLIRIAEDKGIIPRRISNGGIKDFKQFIRETKINYNKLLYIAFDTMKEVYEHFFKEDIFDWYNPDSELLLRALFVFNRYNFSHVNREILGNLYQGYIDREERKRLGQFYTPEEVVDYILDGVGYKSDQEIEGKTLLDPACGSGGFLVPAINRLVERLRSKNFDAITILNKARDNIYGFDINPFAAHLAETNLLFQVMDLISEAKKLDSTFKMDQFSVFVTDSLKMPKEGQKEKQTFLFENNLAFSTASMDAETVKDIKLKRGRFAGGVDFVVGNPPYVKARNPSKILEKQRKELEICRQYKTLYQMWDIYVPFIERGFMTLKMGGRFGFIVSDSFEKAKYATLIRKLLTEETKILEIVFFKNTKLFEEASVHNVIFTFEKGKPPAEHRPKRVLYKGCIKNPIRLSALNQIEHKEFIFKSDYTSKDQRFDLRNAVNLCLICYVSYGLRLNADERYWKGEFRKIDLISYYQDSVHAKHFIEAKDIDRYLIKQVKYVEWNTDRVPYKLVRPTFPDLYKGEKILMARVVGEKPKAMIDFDDLICDNTIVIATPWRNLYGVENRSIEKEIRRIKTIDETAKDVVCSRESLDNRSKDFDLRYILAIVNSSFAAEYLNSIRRGKFDIYPDDYKRLPIKIAPSELQQQFASLVDQILQTNQFLQEIDKLIVDIPGLTKKFQSVHTEYSKTPIVPLSDIPGLTHIQLEKRLGKPKILREEKRVYLARKSYIDMKNEDLAEYIELYLKSIQEILRGLTKQDILRVVKVPQDEKMVEALLFYNQQLKDEVKKLEKKMDEVDRDIDRKVYELYGVEKGVSP